MIAYLKENVYSHFKNGQKDYHQYGNAGDKVKVISDRGNVLIVETESGARYPAESEKVIRTNKTEDAKL